MLRGAKYDTSAISPEPRTASAQSSRGWLILSLLLITPALVAIARKLLTGQPSIILGVTAVAILLGWLWALSQRRPLPSYVAGPLLLWAAFQMLYVIPSVVDDPRIGAAAVLTRIVPMLMAAVAFAAIHDSADFHRMSLGIGGVVLAMLPVSVLIAIYGNQEMPIWLKPVHEFSSQVGGRDFRVGFPAVAGVFPTPAVLSMSMLAAMFVSLASVAVAQPAKRGVGKWWWIIAIVAFIEVWLSTRRGAILGAGVGITFFLVFLNPKDRVKVGTATTTMIVGTIIVLDAVGLVVADFFATRSQFVLTFLFEFGDRIGGVFLFHISSWSSATPFGNYLGFAGPEAKAFGTTKYTEYVGSVEVGGAHLIAEMGIVGSLLMPAIVMLLGIRLYRRSRGLPSGTAVATLLLFQLIFFSIYFTKEMSSMVGLSMAHIIFWAIPGMAASLIRHDELDFKLSADARSDASPLGIYQR